MAIAAYGAARIVSSADASASAVRPLTDQILPTSALSGFVVPRSLSVTHSALSWVRTAEPATDLAFEAARLRRLGFVDGVDEQLHGRIPLAAEAMSIAEHYRSGAGARAQLAHTRQTALDLSGAPAQTITRIRDIDIPGAVGWVTRSAHVTAIKIMFTSGRNYYLIGSGAAPAPPASRASSPLPGSPTCWSTGAWRSAPPHDLTGSSLPGARLLRRIPSRPPRPSSCLVAAFRGERQPRRLRTIGSRSPIACGWSWRPGSLVDERS